MMKGSAIVAGMAAMITATLIMAVFHGRKTRNRVASKRQPDLLGLISAVCQFMRSNRNMRTRPPTAKKLMTGIKASMRKNRKM